jgi:phosphohistidine phosphatase
MQDKLPTFTIHMKQLFLIRHAKSSWKDTSISDFDRKLNPRGKKNAPEMGKRLKKRNFIPDLIISSPAKRAISTAKLVAKELGIDPKDIRIEPKLYEASYEGFLSVIHSIEEQFNNVFVVGHNPSITEVMNELGDHRINNASTCSVMGIGFNAQHWNEIVYRGSTFYFDFPKNDKDVKHELNMLISAHHAIQNDKLKTSLG